MFLTLILYFSGTDPVYDDVERKVHFFGPCLGEISLIEPVGMFLQVALITFRLKVRSTVWTFVERDVLNWSSIVFLKPWLR